MKAETLEASNRDHEAPRTSHTIGSLLTKCNPLTFLLTVEATLPSHGILTKQKHKWTPWDYVALGYYLLLNAAKTGLILAAFYLLCTDKLKVGIV